MTLRDVLHILWRRWLIVLTTTVLIAAATATYTFMTAQSYESTTTLRYSMAASQAFEGTGGYAGLDLDLDPFFVTSEEILEDAAAETDDSTAELQGSTVVTPLEGVRTPRLEVTSQAGSPEQAQARANAVADAYAAHLQGQVDASLGELQADLEEAELARDEAMEAVRDDPDDSVAQGQLSQALSVHLDLSQQVEMMENAGAPATVLQEAPPGQLVGTEPLMLIGIGVIAGLIAGCGVALLREQFDDRLRSAQSMQDAVGQPVLAEVTKVKKSRGGDLSLPVAGTAPTPFNESIRNLRTSLQVAYPELQAVVAITSPAPGDGKTYLMANLAVSVARSGRRVLLVSGDLRRPRAGAYFGLDTDKEGFAEVLQRDAPAEQIEELLLPTQFDGLRLLPAGIDREQPADLLAGDVLPRIVERMRKLADVVLIDAPPGLALSDATLIGTQADGVIVVACMNTTRKRHLESTLHVLEASGASVVGLVANKSKRTVQRGYDAYYHAAEGTNRDPAAEASAEDAGEPSGHSDPAEDAAPARSAE